VINIDARSIDHTGRSSAVPPTNNTVANSLVFGKLTAPRSLRSVYLDLCDAGGAQVFKLNASAREIKWKIRSPRYGFSAAVYRQISPPPPASIPRLKDRSARSSKRKRQPRACGIKGISRDIASLFAGITNLTFTSRLRSGAHANREAQREHFRTKRGGGE